MRRTPLPLENWPAPQLDDEAVDSAIAAMDVQSAAGYNMLDVWGLFATYGWPPDIISAVDKDRRKRIHQLLAAAKHRGILLTLGMGTYSWGYDKIIAADPEVRGKNADGTPHAHAMCDANPKSFEYVKKILDFALGEFDFGGVHLESCDLGCCACPSCAGKDGVVGYNVRINQKTADYIRSKWPGKTGLCHHHQLGARRQALQRGREGPGDRVGPARGLHLRPGPRGLPHRRGGAARVHQGPAVRLRHLGRAVALSRHEMGPQLLLPAVRPAGLRGAQGAASKTVSAAACITRDR